MYVYVLLHSTVKPAILKTAHDCRWNKCPGDMQIMSDNIVLINQIKACCNKTRKLQQALETLHLITLRQKKLR